MVRNLVVAKGHHRKETQSSDANWNTSREEIVGPVKHLEILQVSYLQWKGSVLKSTQKPDRG